MKPGWRKLTATAVVFVCGTVMAFTGVDVILYREWVMFSVGLLAVYGAGNVSSKYIGMKHGNKPD